MGPDIQIEFCNAVAKGRKLNKKLYNIKKGFVSKEVEDSHPAILAILQVCIQIDKNRFVVLRFLSEFASTF